MTRAQVQAYNQGVRDTLANAAAAADAIEKRAGFRDGREGFATAALRGFAEAGEELLIGSLPQQQAQPAEPGL